MIEFKDEILNTSSQIDINPRYTLRDNQSNIISDDVQIELKTPVTAGTPLNRATFMELQNSMIQDTANLVLDYTVDEDTQQLDIINIDLHNKGIYEIFLTGKLRYSLTKLYLQINDITTGYLNAVNGSYSSTMNTSFYSGCQDDIGTSSKIIMMSDGVYTYSIAHGVYFNSTGSNRLSEDISSGAVANSENISKITLFQGSGGSSTGLAKGFNVKIYKRR